MPPKRKFRTNELTIGEKIKLINDWNSGNFTQRDLMSKYEIALGTVSNIIQNRDKYLNSSLNRNKKSKRVKNDSKEEKLNQLVFNFIKTSNDNKIPISGPIIQGFALELAANMGLNSFKASNGWLEKFNKRYDIRYNTYSGESSAVSDDVVNDWVSKMNEMIDGFSQKDIFNFDETGLFYKILPKKSYLIKGTKYVGGKKVKQRITIGLCCSIKGEKLKPVIIGTAKKPRCFKSIKYDINSLGVDYYSNSSAWMTQEIFNKWLKKIDKKFKQENRKVLLFVDNCSTHKTPDNLANIAIKYFPANTTSRLQPLDQGVIHSFKAKYKTYFVKYFTAKISSPLQTDPNSENTEELPKIIKQLMKSIDLKNAINWITSSWDDITSAVISNCFRHSGFDIDREEVELDDNLSEMTEVLAELQRDLNENLMTSSEFTEFEDEFETCSTDWKQDLLSEALSYNNNCNDCDIEEIDLCGNDSSDEYQDESQTITQTSPTTTLESAIDMLEKVENLVIKESPQVLIHLNKVKNALIDLKVRKRYSIQTSITNYFASK
jgi:hypothetical protein